MKLIRKIIGALILFFDKTFTPKRMQRDMDSQNKVNEEIKNLSLYEFPSCPFCVMVRRAMQRLALDIEIRDASASEKHSTVSSQSPTLVQETHFHPPNPGPQTPPT